VWFGRNSSAGAAYVFENQCGQWTQAKETTASDGAQNDSFGYSVGISVDTVVVGAKNKSLSSSTGSVYIFERNQGGTESWGPVQEIPAPNGISSFGQSVGIDGDTLVVGANTSNNVGATYIFERNQGGTENWGQVTALATSDAAPSDQFGFSVGISADTVVVGALGKNSGAGAAYIFERNQGGAETWGQVKELTAGDAVVSDQFGFAVGINIDTVVIGAENKSVGTGAAYIFERNQGGAENWGQVKELTAGDAVVSDQFGFAVGINIDTVVIGAENKNVGTGAAYIFARNQGGVKNWGQVH